MVISKYELLGENIHFPLPLVPGTLDQHGRAESTTGKPEVE
jgi:hypothetical protein